MYRLLYGCVASTIGLQVQDAVIWGTLPSVSPELGRHIDHAQGQMCRMGHPRGGDVHAVFQAPGRFGMAEVTRAWEPPPLVIDERRVGPLQVTAAQDDMRAGLSWEVCCGDHDHRHRWCPLVVKQWRLGHPGLEMPRPGGLLAVVAWDVVVRHLVALLAMGAPPGIGAVVGAGQRRLAAPRGKQGYVALPRHRPGVVVSNMTVQHPGRQRAIPGDQFQDGVEQRAKVQSLRGEGHFGLCGVLAALRTPRATCGEGRFGLPGCGFGLASSLLRGAAHNLRYAPRERAPFLETDPGPRAASQPWSGLALQTGKEPLQSLGVFAGFGHHDFIARQQVDPCGAIPLVTKEPPTARGPRAYRRDNAWHGTLTAPWAGPTGHAAHRDAPRHHPHGQRHPAEVAQGRGRHRRLEAWA